VQWPSVKCSSRGRWANDVFRRKKGWGQIAENGHFPNDFECRSEAWAGLVRPWARTVGFRCSFLPHAFGPLLIRAELALLGHNVAESTVPARLRREPTASEEWANVRARRGYLRLCLLTLPSAP
jgi:hypothetical protein